MTANLDLTALLRSVPHLVGGSGPGDDGERPDPTMQVEMLETESSPVAAEPAHVQAWIDGIQSSMTLTWNEHRPITLCYSAAGAVDGDGTMIDGALKERLWVGAARADVDVLNEWFGQVEGLGPPQHAPEGRYLLVDEEDPPIAAAALARSVGMVRDDLERQTVTVFTVGSGEGMIVVDGSISHRIDDPRLVGVVKSSRTRWLEDESPLWRLPVGWRSAIWEIPAGTHGSMRRRFSCYLRLSDARHQPWHHALVRLEAPSADMLEPLAARCLVHRQHAASGDFRWDRHMGPVAEVERVLRARKPATFGFRL